MVIGKLFASMQRASNLNMLENLLSPVSIDEHLSSSLVYLLLPGSPREMFSVSNNRSTVTETECFVSKHWTYSRHSVQSTEGEISGLVKRMLVTNPELRAPSADKVQPDRDSMPNFAHDSVDLKYLQRTLVFVKFVQ